MTWRWVVWCAALVGLAATAGGGCTFDVQPLEPLGIDAGQPDASLGATDGPLEPPDALEPIDAPVDAVIDAVIDGPIDARPPDSRDIDAHPHPDVLESDDARPSDARQPDARPPDARPPDASPPDARPPDAPLPDAPVDASLPDVLAPPDVRERIDAPPPADARPPVVVHCGAIDCAAGQVCCYVPTGLPADVYTCVNAGQTCLGVAYTCDGPEDCSSGLCCGNSNGSICAEVNGSACTGGFICHTNDDCNGLHCCPGTPYATCSVDSCAN